MKTFEIKIHKTHRNAGGLFVGARIVYPVMVLPEKAWKLVGKKFVKLPGYRVWHIELGLLTHTFSFYFRKPLTKNKTNHE